MAKRKMKKFKGFHNLSAGLFGYRGWYWYKNIGDLWILIKRVFFVLNHGYAPQALWETDGWFIGVMREILTDYRNNRGFVGFFDRETETEEENEKKTNELLDYMIGLLDKMELDYMYDEKTIKESDEAREEFFALFCKYFYSFCD